MVPANLGRDQMSQLGFLILKAHRPPMQAVCHVDSRATVKCTEDHRNTASHGIGCSAAATSVGVERVGNRTDNLEIAIIISGPPARSAGAECSSEILKE